MEDTQTIEQEPQQQDPPVKLKRSEFAAKIKAKHPEYKDVEDNLLVDKIIAKYPEYADTVEPFKKKESTVPSPSLDGQLPSPEKKLHGSVVVGDIENVHAPVEENDPITLARQADELSKKGVTIGEGLEGSFGEFRPDEQAQSDSKKIKEGLKSQGFNADKLNSDFSDFPADKVSNIPGFSKQELLDDYKNNPQLYERKLATAKWQTDFKDQLRSIEKDLPEGEGAKLYNDLLTNLENVHTGDFNQQRETLRRIVDDVNNYGGDKKDKILKNISIDFTNLYGKMAGDKSFIMGNADNKLNSNQAAAWSYIQDVHPEEIGKYKSAFIKDEDIKDNNEAKIGKEEAARKLDELGIQLHKSYLHENFNPIEKEYQALLDKSQKEGLTPEEQQRAQQLEVDGKPLFDGLQMANQDEQDLNQKYPNASYYDTKNFAQELIGQQNTGLERFMTKTGEAVKNTGAGIYDFATSPFMSKQEDEIRQAEILGSGKIDETISYLKQENQLKQTFKPTLSKELQADVDAIKADKSLSDSDKLQATTKLLMSRAGEWQRTPQMKTNVGLKSLMYGIGDMAAGLVPFMGAELVTGGGATAGILRKFTSTFVSAAATGFEDSYREGIEKGVDNPYAYATRVTAINSAAIAGAGTPDKIRAMFSKQKTAIGDMVSKMTDKEIEAALKESPKALSTFKKSLDAVKNKASKTLSAFGSSAISGVKDAAKINAAMSAGRITNDAISGELKSPEEYGKDFLIETLKFALPSAIIGGVSKSIRPTDMSMAAVYESATNKDAVLSALDQKLKDGTITQSEATEVRRNVENAAKIVNGSPFFKSLDDKAKREYLFNSLVEQKNKEAVKGLPDKQAEKYDMAAEVAKHKNGLIVDPKTPEQLEKRKAQLEKSLIPEKDEAGKNIEIPEKEILAAKSEIKAIDEVLEEHNKIVVPESPKIQGEPENISQPIELSTDVTESKPSTTAKNETGVTKEAEEMLNTFRDGSVPAFISKKVEKIAQDNGIEVTDKTTPKEIFDALKEKQKLQSHPSTTVEDKPKQNGQVLEPNVIEDVVLTNSINDKRVVKPIGYFIDVAKLNEDGSADRIYEEAKNPKPISKYKEVELFSHTTESGKIAISDKITGKKILEAGTLKEAITKLDGLVKKYGGEENFSKKISEINEVKKENKPTTVSSIADKLQAKEKLTPEESDFFDKNNSAVLTEVGKRVMAKNKAPEAASKSVEVEDKSPLVKYLDKYNNDEKGHIGDLVNDVEGYANETQNTKLIDAVDKYREQERENLDVWGGRGDTAHEDTFIKAVEDEVSKTENKKSTVSSEGKDAVTLLNEARDTGKLGVFKSMDNEAALKMIAEQAQNIDAKGGEGKPEDAQRIMDATINQFGKELVDAAITKYPKGGNEEVISITHAATDAVAKELGLPEYEEKPETIAEWDAEVDKRLKDNPNAIPEMLKKYRGTGEIDKYDQRMMLKYHAALKDRINKNPTPENIKEYAEAKRLSDIRGGRDVAKSLVARKGTMPVEDDLASFLVQEANAEQVETLPQEKINELKKKYEADQEVIQQLNARIAKLEEDAANRKISEEVKRTKKTNKTHEDFVSERKSIKESISDKLKKARGETSAVVVPYAKELIAISPDVAKLVKSYIEEGVTKLADIVKRAHDDLKEHVPDITERDVRDLVSGKYNERKLTRNEIAAQMRDLKIQQQLLDKIESLEKGIAVEKNAVKKQRSSEEVEKLRERIKELGGDKPTDEQKLQTLKTGLKNKIEKLKKDLDSGDFMKEPEAKKPLKLDEEAQKLQDEHIKFVKETNLRRAKAEFANRGKGERAYDTIMQILGIKRIVQTAVDLSIPARQAVTLMFNPRRWDTFGKSFGSMIQSTFSPKKFDRMMYAIHQSSEYQNMLKDKVHFNEMDAVDSNSRNEEFQKSFVYKIPILREPLLASNRAADGFLNVSRYDMYMKGKKMLERQGITRDNSPESYEALGKWVMNITGRGNLIKFLEDSHAGRMVASNTFFGARLMASRFNLLNPAYYAKMPPAVRIEALKDMGTFVGMISATILAANAAGAKVSTNADDADFLKIKVGNTRYDITGGLVQYVRTYLRMEKMMVQRLNPTISKSEKDKYAQFALGSTTNFFKYKLAPNTSYGLSALQGKDPLGNDFNPADALKIYPMYVDDMITAYKQDGISSLATVALPSILGVGVQTYEEKAKKKEKKESKGNSKKQKKD